MFQKFLSWNYKFLVSRTGERTGNALGDLVFEQKTSSSVSFYCHAPLCQISWIASEVLQKWRARDPPLLCLKSIFQPAGSPRCFVNVILAFSKNADSLPMSLTARSWISSKALRRMCDALSRVKCALSPPAEPVTVSADQSLQRPVEDAP